MVIVVFLSHSNQALQNIFLNTGNILDNLICWPVMKVYLLWWIGDEFCSMCLLFTSFVNWSAISLQRFFLMWLVTNLKHCAITEYIHSSIERNINTWSNLLVFMSTVLHAVMSQKGWLQIAKSIVFAIVQLTKRKKKELNMIVPGNLFLCRKTKQALGVRQSSLLFKW